MYCSFFGFKERPFKVSPDPKFLYLSPYHEEALKAIICGIHDRLGILAVTGEVGTGKTTVLNAALHWVSDISQVVLVPSYALQFDDLLMLILSELEVARIDENLSKIEALDRLKNFALEQLGNGGTVAIIVDEAQNLTKEDLEHVRLLSNLETPSEKLVQIILSGQPELDKKLEDPDLRQLKQRICRRFHLHALGPDETYEYLRHRLQLVSNSNGNVLDTATSEEIWLYSEGIPRKINILCDNALRIAFERKLKALSPPTVSEAALELNW